MDEAVRDALGRGVRAQLEATVATLAGEIVPMPWGAVARTRSLPAVHSLNSVRVTAPADPAEVLAAADRYQADLAFRHIVVAEPGVAAALGPVLAGGRWHATRDLLLALGDAGAPGVTGAEVVELDETEAAALSRRWFAEEGADDGSDALDQLDRYARAEGRVWGERRLGIRDPAGNPVAMTKLRRRAAVWWVEDVYSAPWARRRGYARTLVSRAVALATAEPHDLVFLVADQDDWPKHLYESVGFCPVGRAWTWHLDAGPARRGAHDPAIAPLGAGPPWAGAVRVAEADDYELLEGIETASDRLYEPAGIWPLPPMSPAARAAEHARTVATLVAGRPPVGFCRIERVDGHAHLGEVAVLPEHGRRGIGTTLVDGAVAWAARRGEGPVTLTTYRDVPFNGPWYRRLGWAVLAPPYGPELATVVSGEAELAALGPREVLVRRTDGGHGAGPGAGGAATPGHTGTRAGAAYDDAS